MTAAKGDDARTRLDALVQRARVPGIQYLACARDRTVFEYAGGWADMAGRRPMTPATTLMAYSMCKTITAAAVLQLVESHAINLDEPIGTYLDAQPYGPAITVRQLLAHTSGIPNPIPLRWVHLAEHHGTFDERAALARVLAEHPKPASPPGAKYRYSNIGYWLLGPIVERASGVPFQAYVRDRVLAPIGITTDELGYVVPNFANHAKGYLEKYSFMNLAKRLVVARDLIGGYEGPWLHIHNHYVNSAAFGGLVGSARGVAKFLRDQLSPHSALFGDGTRQLFYARQHVASGATIAMTLGWHTGTAGGAGYFYKEGGGGGFHCMMRVYPHAGLGTVVMTNATGFDVRGLLNETDALFVTEVSRRS